ncbi:MAG: hypothetical protein ACO3AY_07920, partial [Chitinophagaceae bacterium]
MNLIFTFSARVLFSFFILMTSVKSFAQTAVAPQGTGTSADPYIVANLSNLYWVSQNSSSWAAGKYFSQTADIDATTATGWVPIGNSGVRFSGNYNGNGNTISNLTITAAATTANRGIFGYINGATIRNLRVENINLTFSGTSSNYSLGTGSGCFIGQALSNNTIENCSAVNCTSTGVPWYNAIFIGDIGSNGNNITNCNLVGGVINTQSTGALMVGGFVGRIGGSTTFTNCYSCAQVTLVGNGSRLGAFAGQTEHTSGNVIFNKCSSSGSVSAPYSGGFIGMIYGSVAFNDCFSTVSVNGGSGGNIGGFYGWTWSSIPSLSFSNCYSKGSVAGGSPKGGFGGTDAGLSSVTYSNSFWDNQTSGVSTGVGTANRTGLTGATTAAMNSQSTFTAAGWDFTNTWEIASGVNSGYPKFQGYDPSNCSGGSASVTCTVSVASSSPSVCLNSAITSITHSTTGATGIGTATGLPAGLSATWASDVITISGTPTQSGTFSYTIPLTGNCNSTVNATGTITVTSPSTAGTLSGTQAICVAGTSQLTTNGST